MEINVFSGEVGESFDDDECVVELSGFNWGEGAPLEFEVRKKLRFDEEFWCWLTKLIRTLSGKGKILQVAVPPVIIVLQLVVVEVVVPPPLATAIEKAAASAAADVDIAWELAADVIVTEEEEADEYKS